MLLTFISILTVVSSVKSDIKNKKRSHSAYVVIVAKWLGKNKCKIQKLQRGVHGIIVPHLSAVVFAGLPVGGVFFFFKMLILVLIYHNSNMYNKTIPASLLHTKVKMQGIIE